MRSGPKILVPPPVCYAAQTEHSSPKFARAFALGSHGRAVPQTTTLEPGPFAAFCSPSVWVILEQAKREGRTWYYGDHSYFAPRKGRYFRVTKNAMQHDGSGAYPPDRFRELRLDLAPEWQTQDRSSIVICPNSPAYMAQFGIDAKQWTLDIVQQLAQYSDRPIVIRWKSQQKTRPMYVDLHTARLVIVYSSAAAVEALVAGVPVVTLAPFASTYRMGLTDLSQVETPFYPPDREQFLYNLAFQQWSLPEIESGMAWRYLNDLDPTVAHFRRG